MGLFDAIMAPLVAQQQYTNDKALYQQQRLDSIDFTNQMLEYNKPANQIERLKEAGVNPSTLAMNGGAVVSGAGNQSAPAQLPTPVSHDYGQVVSSMISSLANSRLMGAQTKTEDKMRQVRYDNALKQNSEMDARIRELNASSQAQEIANQYAHARETWSLRNQQSVVYMNLQQAAVYQHQVKKFKFELEKILPEELNKIISETKINVMSLDEMTAAIKDYYSKIDERNQNIAESKSHQGLIEAQQGLTEQQTKTEEHQTDIKAVESDNAQIITDKVIEQYNMTIDNIAENTNKTKEEVFWYSFEQEEKTSPQFLGTKSDFWKRAQRSNFMHDINSKKMEQYKQK